MGRFSSYDSDEERLPEGMQRIGYDADTQTYTFRDADGSIWEGPPGARYGHLTKTSDGPQNGATNDSPISPHNEPDVPAEDDDDDALPPPYHPTDEPHGVRYHPQGYTPLGTTGSGSEQRRSWRTELMPLLNFFFLMGLFLLLVFWFFHRSPSEAEDAVCGEGTIPHKIQQGDTCWDVANKNHISLAELIAANVGLDCANLEVGNVLCVPRV